MTLFSHYGNPIEIYCDDCGFVYQHENNDLKDALVELRKINWTIRSKGGPKARVWLHQCGDCNGKNKVTPRVKR